MDHQFSIISVIVVKSIFPWTTKTGLKQFAINSFNIKNFRIQSECEQLSRNIISGSSACNNALGQTEYQGLKSGIIY